MYVRSRTKGQGCPYCNNRRVLKGYNGLATLRPDLAAEWHPVKNGNLKPTDIVPGSKEYVWWQCLKGHEWRAQASRRSNGTGCPVCANRSVIIHHNDFGTEHPTLIDEWNFARNESSPSEFTSGSRKSVWWICKKGHSWKATISDRCRGNNCPKCSEERRVSFPEKTMLYYLNQCFPEMIANYRADWSHPYEMDMYLPEEKIAVEYDGSYGHSKENGVARDIRKNKVCADNGVVMIRVREFGCPPTGSTSIDYMLDSENALPPAISFVTKTINSLSGRTASEPSINIERDSGAIYSLIEFSEKENSLAAKSPDVAKLWHPTKNGRLSPEHVQVSSSKTVWWLGECGHEWRSKISYESSSGKCPYCSGMRVLRGFNDLETVNPELAAEWDYEKNGQLTPKDITAGSGKKVWWKCAKGHSWKAYNHSRNRGNGCPICANRQLLKGFNDVASFLEIAKDWDLEKNTEKPEEVCIGKQNKYFWKCSICGCNWIDSVAVRMAGKGCPECSKIRRSKDVNKTYVKRSGSFAHNYPELLQEWDFKKNNSVMPDQIVSGYGKKVWWKCRKCGHMWMATVTSRSQGRGCPECGRRKRIDTRQKTILDRSKPITITYPAIANEWNERRNKDLHADQVSAGSGKSVWWMCSVCDYEWRAKICERTRGRAKCPGCRGNADCK